MDNQTQYDPELFAEFFDWQPQSFIWLRPVWDKSGKSIIDFSYVYGNDVGLAYLNLSRERLQKICISNTPSLTDDMRPAILQEMVHVYTTGETSVTEVYNPVINKYGTVYRIKFRGGVLTTIHDKTGEKRAILELSKKTKELQKLNENLEEFAYAASHDLQEPLRKITSFSDQLSLELKGQLSSAHQNLLNRLQSSAIRMRELISDLLEYSQVNVKQPIFKPVDLSEVVRETLQDLESATTEASVVITVGDLPIVMGDRRQMQQLFQNLVGNAIKYRREQGVPAITIQSKIINENDGLLSAFPGAQKSKYHFIEVADNGIGFEQEYAEKIFQVFQRLHGSSEYKGTGIGLAIVQKVVTNHKGFIKANSSPGVGTSFQILLPF